MKVLISNIKILHTVIYKYVIKQPKKMISMVPIFALITVVKSTNPFSKLQDLKIHSKASPRHSKNPFSVACTYYFTFLSFLFPLPIAEPRIELRASHIQGKCSTSELHPWQLPIYF